MVSSYLFLVREKLNRPVLQLYADTPESSYQWDSTVPNHLLPQIGDTVFLWTERGSLGVSVIENIFTGVQTKSLAQCPNCGLKQVRERSEKTPRFRCSASGCGHKFEFPNWVEVTVTTFATDHSPGWVDLDGRFTAAECRSIGTSQKSQHSIRKIEDSRLKALLTGVQARAMAPLQGRRKTAEGFTTVTVRARIGQGNFRDALRKKFRDVCAVTGEAPQESLEAAHLYSYAKLGEHHESGGLLLRRDIHRLFDRGLIRIDPKNLTVHLDDAVKQFSMYRELEGTNVKVDLSAGHIKWLALHWAQFGG